jgi:RNA polymerase sigma factor for flagellar operon FliA
MSIPIKHLPLWKKYKRQRTIELRNKLVELYMPLVKPIAMKVHHRLHRAIPYDALLSAGYVGLIQAVEKFDHKKGFRFTTYAPGRIRGSMMDYVREIDFVPRLARSRQSKHHKELNAKTHELGRVPKDFELKTQSQKIIDTHSLSTESRIADEFDKLYYSYDHLADDPVINKMLVLDNFKEYSRRLDIEEKIIVYLYYYKDQTMSNIGKVLNLSDSRVSQLHSHIIIKFKQMLDPVERIAM